MKSGDLLRRKMKNGLFLILGLVGQGLWLFPKINGLKGEAEMVFWLRGVCGLELAFFGLAIFATKNPVVIDQKDG